MLLSYIANPQLELALVMLIVPFIVNVSAASFSRSGFSSGSDPGFSPPVVHHVLGGRQPDDEEVQVDEVLG